MHLFLVAFLLLVPMPFASSSDVSGDVDGSLQELPGERFRPTFPDGDTEYVPVCLPAF